MTVYAQAFAAIGGAREDQQVVPTVPFGRVIVDLLERLSRGGTGAALSAGAASGRTLKPG